MHCKPLWYIVGWRDFEKKCYTFYFVPNCCWTPIPKFNVSMLPLSLVAGPQKIWTVTLKSAKKCCMTFLKPATGGKVFFDLLKLQMK